MKRVVTVLVIHTDNSIKTNILFSLIPMTQLPVQLFSTSITEKICSILLASPNTVADTKSTNPRNMQITMSIPLH